MQQFSKVKATSRANPLVELDPVKSFVHDLAAAIVSNASDLEGVWNITNRVYDRWVYERGNLPGKVAHLHRDQDLARSA